VGQWPIDLYSNRSPLKDRGEGESADVISGRRAGAARAAAAFGGDVSRAQGQWRAHPFMWLRVKGMAGTSFATCMFKLRIEIEWFEKHVSTVPIPGKKHRPANARSPTRLVANAAVVFQGAAHIELSLRNFSQVFRPKKFQGKVGRFEPRTLTAQI
jgi:hypothetical protein